MYPKVRSPFLVWLLMIFTGGIYYLYWIWAVTTEINNAESSEEFAINKWRNLFVALFAALISISLLLIFSNLSVFITVMALLLFSLFIHVQLKIGSYIKKKDLAFSTNKEHSNILSVVLLWMVANAGIAYMQVGINRVIENERNNS